MEPAPISASPRVMPSNPTPSNQVEQSNNAQAEALPVSAVPPQGTVGKPPIENISTQTQPQIPIAPAGVGPIIPNESAQQAASQAVGSDTQVEQAQADEALMEESEQALISDMKATIQSRAQEVSIKVSKNAFKHIFQKTNWLNRETAMEAEKFFTIKVPRVLATELSHVLNEALGLGNDPPPSV